MKNSRPKSYSKFKLNTKNSENISSFSKTSTGFYTMHNNNKINNMRLYSSNIYIPKFKKKLFSLLDINDKVTDSNGTSLPIQYKKITDEENKRQFGFLYREEQNYNLELIKNFLNNMHTSKYAKKKEKKDNNDNKEENKKKKEKKIEIKIEQNNKEKEYSRNNMNDNNTKRISKTESKKPKIIIKNRNDIWLPKGYSHYELIVKNPKLLKEQLKNNVFANNYPDLTLNKIRRISNESDIFFKKPITFKENLYNKKIYPNNYNSSDIFHLTYKIENLIKCSEKYLFKQKPKDKYYITKESESKWSPKVPFLGFMNSPSTEYNIMNPSKKNTIGFTRDKIITEVEKNRQKNIEEKKLDKKISKSVNYMNPIYRQKGIGEFIDITRNGGNNVGKDFLGYYHRNNNCFKKNNEACATFYNSYLFYKDICQKPFTLNPTLKTN